MHSFFISVVFFKVKLSMPTKLLISSLFHVYNMRCKIEYAVIVLRSASSLHYLTWKFKLFGFVLLWELVLDENLILIPSFLWRYFSIFQPHVILSSCLYVKEFQSTQYMLMNVMLIKECVLIRRVNRNFLGPGVFQCPP